MKQLTYDLQTAHEDCGESRHAQKVMNDLGITYQHSTPQSMGDCWWFWNCENLPNELPSFLSVADRNPMKCVGYGLSQEDAEKIRDGINAQA